MRVLAKGEDAVKQDLGRLYCVVGLLFGVGGILFALLDASAKVSAGVVGAALGVLGYFLGARRLRTATILLGVVAVFFMAAASTGRRSGRDG